MTRIAAPMVGGMGTAPLLSMLVVPAAWLLMQRARYKRQKSLWPAQATAPTAKSKSVPASI
jgi:hypothetical protein